MPTHVHPENSDKALDILLESLKLYITLSTLSIGGVMTYYLNAKPTHATGLFYISLILFGLCVLFSVYCINQLINRRSKGLVNVHIPSLTLPNFIAIGGFVLGIISTSILILSNPV